MGWNANNFLVDGDFHIAYSYTISDCGVQDNSGRGSADLAISLQVMSTLVVISRMKLVVVKLID